MGAIPFYRRPFGAAGMRFPKPAKTAHMAACAYDVLPVRRFRLPAYPPCVRRPAGLR